MRVWLIHMGENVQSDGPDVRLYRLGTLAAFLDLLGHDVERWVPTFSHNSLHQRFDRDTDVRVSDRHVIRHIYAAGFRRHHSVARLHFHRVFARRWVELGSRADHRPDLIVTSMPTPEITEAGLRLARRFDTPVAVDVRDLWPDVYATVVPPLARPFAQVAIRPMRARVGRALKSASALLAVSQTYLDWALELAGRSAGPLDRIFPLSYQPPAVEEGRVQALMDSWARRLAGARLVCLFLGTFTRFFALEDVLGAARILQDRRPGEVAWVLAGDGPTRQKISELAGETRSVILPGWVGSAESIALLRLADIGLAPYATNAPQSLPNKPFEYAWAGLPVVSSLRGELERIVDSRLLGTNYPCGDPPALAAAVESMLDDASTRAVNATHARQYWETEISPQAVYGDFVKHLEEVAASGCRPSRAAR
jgi:glycosyltransferase involved in cell wall biosynthesis